MNRELQNGDTTWTPMLLLTSASGQVDLVRRCGENVSRIIMSSPNTQNHADKPPAATETQTATFTSNDIKTDALRTSMQNLTLNHLPTDNSEPSPPPQQTLPTSRRTRRGEEQPDSPSSSASTTPSDTDTSSLKSSDFQDARNSPPPPTRIYRVCRPQQ